jgi:hypothetical protein
VFSEIDGLRAETTQLNARADALSAELAEPPLVVPRSRTPFLIGVAVLAAAATFLLIALRPPSPPPPPPACVPGVG